MVHFYLLPPVKWGIEKESLSSCFNLRFTGLLGADNNLRKSSVSSCEAYSKVRTQYHIPKRIRKNTFPSAPLELTSIDYLVQSAGTSNGKKLIVHISTSFSKFTQLGDGNKSGENCNMWAGEAVFGYNF